LFNKFTSNVNIFINISNKVISVYLCRCTSIPKRRLLSFLQL